MVVLRGRPAQRRSFWAEREALPVRKGQHQGYITRKGLGRENFDGPCRQGEKRQGISTEEKGQE